MKPSWRNCQAGAFPGRALTEDEVAEIDRYEKRLRNFSLRFVIGVDAACGRHLDALEIPVIRRVIGAGGAAQNVDRIVVPPHQAIGSEMRDLRFGVADDVVRKSHLEAAPDFAVFFPGFDLLTFEPGIGVNERKREVGP
jgi:hypothetical protein